MTTFYSISVAQAGDDGIWRTTGGTSFNNTGSLVVGGSLSLATFVAFDVPDPLPDLRWGVQSTLIRVIVESNGPTSGQNATITIIDPATAVPTNHTEAQAMVSLAPSVAWAIPNSTAGDTLETPDLAALIEAWHEEAGPLTTAPSYLFKFMWGENTAGTAASFESYDTFEAPDEAPISEMYLVRPQVAFFRSRWG